MPDYPNYNPVGALNNTFAPAYIPGYAPSEQAIMQRQATRGLTGMQNQGMQYLDELRTPPVRRQVFAGGGFAPSGNFSQGSIDPAALRAVAQNLPYDVQARRNAIAEVVAQRNTQSASASQHGNWTIPGQVGPEFGRALQQQGLMPAELTYHSETQTWS